MRAGGRDVNMLPIILVLVMLLVVTSTVIFVRLASYRAAQNEFAAYRLLPEQADTAVFDLPSGGQAETYAPDEEAQGNSAVPEESLVAPSVADAGRWGFASPEEAAALAAAAAASDAQNQALQNRKPFFSGKVSVLMKDNSDTVGWLDVLGTKVQYPIVQGTDNQYYVNHTFAKRKNDSGAIFMDSASTSDFSGFNTVIYGHNMKDGSMFSGLREYQSQRYAQDYSVIEVTQLRSKKLYRIFAAYVSQGEKDFDFRGFQHITAAQRRIFLRDMKRKSDVTLHVDVTENDNILTLVTCTGGVHDWYWVVHAVLFETQDYVTE